MISTTERTDSSTKVLLYFTTIFSLITAFLTHLTEHVLLDGSSHDTDPVSSGVPFGTVLYIIYFNDLPLCTHSSSTRLFVNDSVLLGAVKTTNNCTSPRRPEDPSAVGMHLPTASHTRHM